MFSRRLLTGEIVDRGGLETNRYIQQDPEVRYIDDKNIIDLKGKFSRANFKGNYAHRRWENYRNQFDGGLLHARAMQAISEIRAQKDHETMEHMKIIHGHTKQRVYQRPFDVNPILRTTERNSDYTNWVKYNRPGRVMQEHV